MSDSEIPPETIASIQHELGEKERNSVKKLVRVETKPEKWEDRILVLSICRAFIFSVSTKSSVKLEHGYHYLDIQSIESRNLLQLKIGTTGGMFCYRLTTKGDADEIITHIGASLKKIFPNRQFEKLVITVNLEPIERKEKILTTLDSLEMEDLGPCGGFSSMYMCMCDYHHLPYREEITWDVDTIYLSQSSKHMCLNDFDHLDGRDLIPVVAALEHNDWFNKISVQDIKLHPDVTKQLIKVLKKNGNIQELVLENTGILKGEELGKKLASAMHGPCKLLVLNLSGNHVDDVGVIHLSGVLRTQAEGLVELNLSNTKMTAKAASNLGASLQSGKIKSTLKKLNLSENSFKGEEFLQMLNFLAQPNVLSNLYLSNCDLALDTLFTSFSNGCTHTLQHLDVSKNVFTTKKAKEILVPQSIKKYFANSTALKSCNLSSNKLPPEALKEILLGIASNKVIRELKLDLSCNELKYEGADIIEGCIGNIAAIGSLDISENGFDVRTGQLIDWIRQNKFIKHLFVGGNLHSVRQHRRQLGKVLDTIVTLLQEDDSVLESLSLADSKLKADTATVLDAVGSNTQLTYLDIRGNQMGDIGARMMGKALQINTKLKTILWDRNNVGPNGLQDIAKALENNITVQSMQIPISDAGNALRANAEKTEVAMLRIEELLKRNNSMSESQSQVTDKIYILGKRFDVSASQQVVMKLSKGVEQAIDHLGDTEDENIKSDIAIAQKYLEDAARSKQLLDKMYQKAKETSKAVILAKIQEMTEIITSTVHEQLEKSVNEMVTCGETLCPAVMQEHLKKDILETAKHKSQLSENYVQEWMEKQAGSAIANKASELHLSAATAICNKIIDDILDSLAKSRRQLNMHLSEISQQEKIKRDQEQKKEDEEKEVEDEEEEVDDEEKEVEDEEKEDSVEKKDDEENEENDVVSSPLKEPGIENVMSIMRKRLSQRPKSIIITDSTKLIHDVSPMETPETTPTMPVKALMRVKDNSSSDDEPDIGEQRKTTPNGNDNISQDSSFGASSGDELGHGKEISVTPVSPVTPIKHVSPEVIRPPSASPIEDFGDLPTQHTPLNRITSGRPRPNRNIKIRPTKPIVAIAEEAKVNNTGTVTTNAIVENQNLGEEKNINVTEGVETFFSTNNVLSPENVRPAQVNTNVTSPKSPDKKKMAKKDKKEKKGKKDKKDKDEKDKKDEKKDKKEKKEDKDKKEKSFLSGFRKLPNPFSRQPKTPPREMSPSSESIRSRSSISPSTEESPQRNEHTKVKTTYSSPIPDDNLYEPVEPDICKEKPVEKKKPSLEQETIQNDHPPRDHEGEKEDGKKDQQEDEPVLITAKKTVGAVAMPGMGAVLDSGILAEMKQKQKLSENSKNSEPDETKKAEQQLDVKKPLAKESVSDGILDEMKRKQKLSENRKNSAPDETKQDKQIDSKKAPAKDSPTELINVPKTETHVNITTKQSSSPKAVRQPGSPKPSPRKLSKGNEAEGEPGELKSSPLLLRRASGSPKTISPATSPKPKHRMLLSKQTDSAPKTAAALYSEVKAKSAEAVNPTPRPRSSQVITTRPLSSVPATTTDKESKDSVSPVPRPRSRAISGAHPPTEVPSSPTSKPAKPAKPAKPPPIMPKPVTKRPSSRIGGSPPVVRKTPPSLRAEGEVVREKQKFSVKERANIYSKGGVPKHTPETSLPLTANTEADSVDAQRSKSISHSSSNAMNTKVVIPPLHTEESCTDVVDNVKSVTLSESECATSMSETKSDNKKSADVKDAGKGEDGAKKELVKDDTIQVQEGEKDDGKAAATKRGKPSSSKVKLESETIQSPEIDLEGEGFVFV